MAMMSIPLASPVEVNGGTISELTIRELTAKDTREAQERWAKAGNTVTAFWTYQMNLLSIASGVAADVLRTLPVSTIDDAQDFVVGLIDSHPAPLPKPPPSLSIEFDPPMVSGGVTYSNINLQEPSAGDFWTAEAVFNDGAGPAYVTRYKAVLVSKVAGVPFTVIESMPISQVNEAAAYCRGFRKAGRGIGASSQST